MTTTWTIEELTLLVKQYKFVIGTESEFQDGLAHVLEIHDVEFQREYDLGGDYGRIDFFLPGQAIGIELKIKGSPSEVMRQLHRYALCPDIRALMLVTARARLAFAPMEIHRKPLLSASVWQGLL